ncbi:MAG TPA: histidinol dehydrogenase [Solirubrobacteraceae bacterium]|jgi:sulfopropanediol 3-dehydrogenase|nr:histidinol dehydrogenase [Solirubrobacteraceae bacterium]
MNTRYLKEPNPPTTEATEELRSRVSQILKEIEQGGIDAVRRYSQELDNWAPADFVVSDAEFERASSELDDPIKQHIAFAQNQIRTFATAQRGTVSELEVEVGNGVMLGHRLIPVNAVGAYVPGGRYPMLASSFMTVLVAKVAGVKQVVACAPPQRENGIHPTMLYAMRTSGADAVLCLGGVQALAAMAFGLIDGLAPVDMLVGAGNAFVAEAKRQLFGRVGIDLLAGPTEVLVIADGSADPRLVATDLLGQAEHGPNSPAGCIAIGEDVARAVQAEVEDLLNTFPTAEVAGQAWSNHGWIAIAHDDEEAVAIADAAADEHLEVQVAEEKLDWYLQRLSNYGSLFLGEQATVAYGDKAVGTNHVLPTSRAARYTGGLWVGKFLKTCTYQRLTPEGTRLVAPAVAAISHEEHFEGHALTAEVRLARLAEFQSSQV